MDSHVQYLVTIALERAIGTTLSRRGAPNQWDSWCGYLVALIIISR